MNRLPVAPVAFAFLAFALVALALPATAVASDMGLLPVHGRYGSMPEEGWDVRYADQLAALGYQTAPHIVRIEARRKLPEPFDPNYPAFEDGVGVVVRPGLVVTTARYVKDVDSIDFVLRDLTKVPVQVKVLDEKAGLALVGFDRKACPGLTPVPAVVAVPDTSEIAATVAIPTGLTGVAPGLRLAAAMVDADGEVLLSGAGLNGLPAFDHQGRLVALAVRPTPTRQRAIARNGGDIAAWLPGAVARATAR